MTRTDISKTAAIAMARKYVNIGSHGRQYVIYSPWDWSNPSSGKTASHPRDWWTASGDLTKTRAAFALSVMGVDYEFLNFEDLHYEGKRTLRALVTAAIDEIARTDAALAANRAKFAD